MPALFLAMLAAPTLVAYALWPAHGLLAEYDVVVKTDLIPCVTLVEPGMYFAKRQLFAGPVYMRWQTDKFGDNQGIPVLQTTWRGWLRVPAGGHYFFRSATPGILSITIDSRTENLPRSAEVGPITLAAGFHQFVASYRGDTGPQLTWQRNDEGFRTLGWSNFYRTRPILPLAKTAGIVLFLALFAGEAAWLARRRPVASDAVWNFVASRRAAIALAALLLVTLATRAWRYDRMPYANETADEYDSMLNGLSLVYRGEPSGWSQLPAYRHSEIKTNRKIFGENFTIVEPFFDHTPGLALVTGLLLRGWGVEFSERYDRYFIRETRPLPIALAVVTALLIYFLAVRALGRRDLALLAVAFYALNPTAAFAGRLLKDENVLTPLFVGALLFAARYLDSRSRAALAGAALAAGLSCVFKGTGVAVVGATAAVLVLERRWNAALIVIGVGVLFFSTYFAYGAIFGWETFKRVFANLQTREYAQQLLPALSTRGLWTMLTDTGVTTARFGGLTYVWFWWCAVVFWRHFSVTGEAGKPSIGMVIWPLMIMLVFTSVTISSDKSFGWYRIPLMPFLVIVAAWCVGAMLREGDVMLTAIFCLAPLVDAAYWTVFMPATAHAAAYKLFHLVPFAGLFLTYLLPSGQRRTAVRTIGAVAVALAFVLMAATTFAHWYNYNLEY
jgi:hypothetical protein